MERMVLEGLKIVEFGRVFAGPFIAAYLGDYGAEVIKVESHSSVDLTRQSAPFKDGVTGIDRSGTFPVSNNSKYGVTLNLKHPQASGIIKKLISWADIVVENFGAGTIERLGLSYDKLKKIKPDIIMLSATIQGQTGPRSTFVGYGYNTVALTGIANLTGWPDRSPVGTLQAYPDSVVPWFSVVAILAALDHRRRTGKGQYIDISQYETTSHLLAPLLLDYTANNRVATRAGNQCPYAAPHGVYHCKGDERWCAITVFNEEEWAAFCRVIGSPAWTKGKKFTSIDKRKENEEELNRLVEQWTTNHTAEEIMNLMQQAGVAAGVVKTNKEMFEDPQLEHRGYFQRVEHSEMGQILQQAWPIRLSESQAKIRPAPCLGEHNEYVSIKILRLSDQEFVELLAAGVFE